jgi:hypothetical protein
VSSAFDAASHKTQEYLDTRPFPSYSLADAAMQQSEVSYGSGNKA